MLRKTISFIWEKTPPFLRMRAIRATQQKFTVSVAAVITDHEKKVLLLDHVLRPFYNWGLPGGFMEPNEQPEAAIRRELAEETGLELKNIKMIRVRTVARHVEILFRAESVGIAAVKSREINALGWFTFAEMPDKISAAQRALIENVLHGEI